MELLFIGPYDWCCAPGSNRNSITLISVKAISIVHSAVEIKKTGMMNTVFSHSLLQMSRLTR